MDECETGYFSVAATDGRSICVECNLSTSVYVAGRLMKQCYSSGCPMNEDSQMYIIQTTSECVAACPTDLKVFENMCVKECPRYY